MKSLQVLTFSCYKVLTDVRTGSFFDCCFPVHVDEYTIKVPTKYTCFTIFMRVTLHTGWRFFFNFFSCVSFGRSTVTSVLSDFFILVGSQYKLLSCDLYYRQIMS
jgi:hypothetical protein